MTEQNQHSDQRVQAILDALMEHDAEYGHDDAAIEALQSLFEQLRSREDALREVYELIYLGEPDNALHGLDAYMIREGIFRGEAASSPATVRDSGITLDFARGEVRREEPDPASDPAARNAELARVNRERHWGSDASSPASRSSDE